MIVIPNKQSIKHKNQLLRTLRALLKNKVLANTLIFKGGTYAALLGKLDRFSVDLDFDIIPAGHAHKQSLRIVLHQIFSDLKLQIKDESVKHLQFFLRYDAPENERNTLKIEVNDQVSKFNEYESAFLKEVDMYCRGHTEGTMFANKLVAAKARFDEGKRIAGRDFYDIHHFFTQGLDVNEKVVEDLTKLPYQTYLNSLANFIEKHIEPKKLQQDLNPLLPKNELDFVVHKLKPELLLFLKS